MRENKMKNINEYLYKYGLHDCLVDKIYAQNDLLVFYFKAGVYNLNEKGAETTKTRSCVMYLKIEDLNTKRISEHIEISKIVKNKIREVDYGKFVSEVDKFNFEIIENYISCFGQSVLLDGYVSRNRYQIKVSEIKKIEFNFK